MHVQDNNVTTHNDQNNAFNEAFIDVYILEIFYPKGFVYSQPQGRYQLKQYKEPLNLILCLFVLIYFFILLNAMSESTLEKLRCETREGKLEKKNEAFRKEQIKKERT